jgi:hypothetical protein
VIALPLVLLSPHEHVGFFEVCSTEDEQRFAREYSDDILKHRTHHVLHLKLDSYDLPVVIPSRQIQADDSMKRKNGNYKKM